MTDMDEAIKYYDMAIAKGNHEALYNKAIIYYQGRGVERNRKEAKKLMKQAAAKGLSQARYFLDNNKF